MKNGPKLIGDKQKSKTQSKASPPLHSGGVDYFYGSVDMKVSALCTFVHLQKVPFVWRACGTKRRWPNRGHCWLFSLSPLRPAKQSVSLFGECVFFIYLPARAATVRPRCDNRFHWSINSRRSLCVCEKYISPVAELRKGNSSLGERNLSQAIVDLDLAQGDEKNRSCQWQAEEGKESSRGSQSLCLLYFPSFKSGETIAADLPLRSSLCAVASAFSSTWLLSLTKYLHQLPLNIPIRVFSLFTFLKEPIQSGFNFHPKDCRSKLKLNYLTLQ